MGPKLLIAVVLVAALAGLAAVYLSFSSPAKPVAPAPLLVYEPRRPWDSGGFSTAIYGLKPWEDATSLKAIQKAFDRLGYKGIERIDAELAQGTSSDEQVKHCS